MVLCRDQPIRLVDGAIKTIRMINNRDELLKELDNIDNVYKKLGTFCERLDGIQNREGKDFCEEYFKRWHNEHFNEWHIGHAKNLIDRTKCKSILEVGCGMGNIVRGFLKNGVDAWGLDISKYAIENCNDEIRLSGSSKRIIWGDISNVDTLPKRKFDLVIGYDIFEHAPNPELVVRNFCNLSGQYLHIKIPDIRGLDPKETKNFDPTHITGRSIKWWLDKFKENGFQLLFDTGYTWLKFDPEYALSCVGAPDLLGLFGKV